MQHLILHSPLPLAFLVAFAAGALSFLSPCVLPLVPGYLSMMSGVATSDLTATGGVQTRTDQRRLLSSTLLFVAGFTIVFVLLGAAATAVTRTLLEHQRVLNQVAGVLIIAMGLVLAGFVTPAFVQRERRFHVSPSRLGVFAAPVMGMAFAIGWTPCIGPALSAVLLLAGAEGTLTRGIAMLLAYSLGLGLPFVLSGVAFGRLTGVFTWVKRHFRLINVVSGLLLATFGFILLTNNVHVLSSWFGDLLRTLHLDRLTYS